MWANLRTTVGADYLNNEGDGSNASGTHAAAGRSDGWLRRRRRVRRTQSPTATKTLGYYAQEQIALRDRLFLTAAVRYDQNTAFGTQYKGVPYPKFSASYNISDESFFPHWDVLNSLHLRLAYGASGVQPGATSALRTFSTTTTNIVSDVTGLLASAIGNPNIKPETSAEWETGFDSRILNNKVNVEFTYYSKQTKDALLNLNIAPSAGASAGSILKNLGSVKNAGAELSVNAQLVDRRNFGWDVTVGGAHNKNKLVTLGKDDAGKDLPRTGSTTRNQAGYPLNSIWTVPYTWSDANGDGLIGANEVDRQRHRHRLHGPVDQRRSAHDSERLRSVQRKLRITVLGRQQGRRRDLQSVQLPLHADVDVRGEVESERAALGSGAQRRREQRHHGQRHEVHDELRLLRERTVLALSRSVGDDARCPTVLMQRYLRAQHATLTFGVRNLKVWTKYTGEDPESNYGRATCSRRCSRPRRAGTSPRVSISTTNRTRGRYHDEKSSIALDPCW